MTANKRDIGSDLAKVDASVVSAEDLVEIPELDDGWFERALVHESGVPVKRGRPKSDEPKIAVNLRLTRRVLEGFRASGPGWQTRMNAALEQWLADHPIGETPRP